MYKCCVCNKPTYNFKTCIPSERMLAVCEECADKAPLDTVEGFSDFCAKRIFRGENMESVLNRYRHVKDNVLSFFNISERVLRSNIDRDISNLIKENIASNKYYEPLFHMSDIPSFELQKGEVDPIVYRIYKSPINNSYWCASGYDKRSMTFSGCVYGLDLGGTSFTVEELYSYMAVEFTAIKLPMRLSDVQDMIKEGI